MVEGSDLTGSGRHIIRNAGAHRDPSYLIRDHSPVFSTWKVCDNASAVGAAKPDSVNGRTTLVRPGHSQGLQRHLCILSSILVAHVQDVITLVRPYIDSTPLDFPLVPLSVYRVGLYLAAANEIA